MAVINNSKATGSSLFTIKTAISELTPSEKKEFVDSLGQEACKMLLKNIKNLGQDHLNGQIKEEIPLKLYRIYKNRIRMKENKPPKPLTTKDSNTSIASCFKRLIRSNKNDHREELLTMLHGGSKQGLTNEAIIKMLNEPFATNKEERQEHTQSVVVHQVERGDKEEGPEYHQSEIRHKVESDDKFMEAFQVPFFKGIDGDEAHEENRLKALEPHVHFNLDANEIREYEVESLGRGIKVGKLFS